MGLEGGMRVQPTEGTCLGVTQPFSVQAAATFWLLDWSLQDPVAPRGVRDGVTRDDEIVNPGAAEWASALLDCLSGSRQLSRTHRGRGDLVAHPCLQLGPRYILTNMHRGSQVAPASGNCRRGGRRP